MRFLFLVFIIISNTVSAGIFDIKFTEIMYNPTDEGSTPSTNLEFIELKNTGVNPVVMDGISIQGAISYTFPLNTTIASGEFFVIASNPIGFSTRYLEITPNAQYMGNLKNSGERIFMITGFDTILNFRYNDNVPWPILADGNGFSIVPTQINPSNDQTEGNHWMPSANINGSPGFDDPVGISFANVYINECLSHTDLPNIDAVEIYNASNNSVDISYWYVSDDRSNLKSYQFPNGSIIEPGGYLVIDENDFNPGGSGFRLNRSGDNIYLVSGNSLGEFTGFEQGWSFGAEYNGTSLGVHITSELEKHFVAQSSTTLGSLNSYPRIGPLIVTDVSYHPDITGEEYIIIENISDSTVNLWDATLTDSTWGISGIKFKFPYNTSVGNHDKIILCNIDTSNFRIKYSIPNHIKIFQYPGKMNNDGERISIYGLLRSDTAGANNDSIFMPKVIIDEVRYNDNDPWPLSADGFGDRLHRIDKEGYANDPENWTIKNGNMLSSEITFGKNIKIFPTISENEITIEFPNYNSWEISLKNIEGKINLINKIKSSSTSIYRNNLAKGLYIMEISSQEYRETKKIIFK
tara:strand:+ start:10345 stop:12078 length:1734 start_codon:yes stop_codon:yes gene_type:complete